MTSTASTDTHPNWARIGVRSLHFSSAARRRSLVSWTTSSELVFRRLVCRLVDSTCKFPQDFEVHVSDTDWYYSFAIGYIYSFFAAGVFYWLFNRFFPHPESMLDHAETGEDVIAANDAKNVQERRASWSEGHKPSIVERAFQV